MHRKKAARALFILVAIVGIAIPVYFRKTAATANAYLRHAFPGDSKAVLDHSRHLTLLSLEPDNDEVTEAENPNRKSGFHSYKVLGQTQITEPKLKSRLLAALYHSIAYND